MTDSDLWDAQTAERYDSSSADMYAPEVLGPTVDFLAELAGDGPACEFAIGTGRVGIALADRGVAVSGVELSQPMVDQLHRKRPGLPVTIGDMSKTLVGEDFSLVYLVFNTIGNLYTQDAQVQCFANAARHLRPGGSFVVEVGLPQLRRLPPGQTAIPFNVSAEHVDFDTYDVVTQRATSHHYIRGEDETYRYAPHNYRYVWPSELDLMARLAGMNLLARYADWDRSEFTEDSTSHVSVWRLPR